jgi:hypothetical protein
MASMRRAAVSIAAIVVLASTASRADDEPQVPITHVELQENAAIKAGKVAAYEGEADEKGVVFLVEGLSILTPVAVALEARDPAEPMTLELKNDLSLKWDRTEKTTSAGAVLTRFRTEGTASARVRTSGGRKPFRIVFWVGPEVKLHTAVPPPFGGAASAAASGSSAGVWIGVVAGVLALIAVIAVVARRRKRRSNP